MAASLVLGGLIPTVRLVGHPIAITAAPTLGRVFVLTRDEVSTANSPGHLIAIDAVTGRIIYSMDLGVLNTVIPAVPCLLNGGEVATLEVDAPANRIVVLTADHVDVGLGCPTSPGRAILLNAKTGAIVRTVTVGVNPTEAAVDVVAGRIYVANEGEAVSETAGTVSVLDASSGRVMRTLTPPFGASVIAVAPTSGRIVVGGASGTAAGIAVLDARSGRDLATVRTSDIPALAVDDIAGQVVSGVTLSRYQSSLLIMNARTGAVLHRLTLNLVGAYPSIDVLAHHVLVEGASDYTDIDGVMLTLDDRTGRVISSFNTALLPQGYLPTNTTAIVGANFGTAVAVSAALGRAFTADYELGVFDTRTGRFLGALSLSKRKYYPGTIYYEFVSGEPRLIAVDERIARIFIANGFDGTVSVFDTNALHLTPP